MMFFEERLIVAQAGRRTQLRLSSVAFGNGSVDSTPHLSGNKSSGEGESREESDKQGHIELVAPCRQGIEGLLSCISDQKIRKNCRINLSLSYAGIYPRGSLRKSSPITAVADYTPQP